MALPKEVQDALSRVQLLADTESEWADIAIADWQTIRAHLLSQDAEIARYKVAWTEYNDRTEWVQKTAKPKELGLHRADVLRLRIESAESRLAAADELLREATEWNWLDDGWLVEMKTLDERIAAHLSENSR